MVFRLMIRTDSKGHGVGERRVSQLVVWVMVVPVAQDQICCRVGRGWVLLPAAMGR